MLHQPHDHRLRRLCARELVHLQRGRGHGRGRGQRQAGPGHRVHPPRHGDHIHVHQPYAGVAFCPTRDQPDRQLYVSDAIDAACLTDLLVATKRYKLHFDRSFMAARHQFIELYYFFPTQPPNGHLPC